MLVSRSERDIKIYAHAKMKEYNLIQTGWKFKISGRMTITLGLCNYSTKTITISKKFCSVSVLEDIQDCVLHEIAHALAGYAAGHGKAWQAMAVRVGAIPKATKKVVYAEDTNQVIPVFYLEKPTGIEVVCSMTMNKYNKIKSGRINLDTLFLPKRRTETLGNIKAMLLETNRYEELKSKS